MISLTGRGCRTTALVLAVFAALGSPALADDEPPPLPLHTFEGTGGAFTTQQAYLVNPAPEKGVLGLPSFGYIHVHMGNGKHLEAATATETVWGRLELGYGLNYLDMGDLPEDVERTFGDTVKISDHAVTLHNFNARYNLVREGDFDIEWMPAITFGIHYKQNDTIEDLDDDLGGALAGLGIEDDAGFDFTATATKRITSLPVPFALSLTVRSTESAHAGLLGFTGERKIVFEAGICAMVADGVFAAAEYRQKPDEYTPVPGLLEGEDDWWTVDVCFVVSSHVTIAVGYAHFGNVLNHEANKSYGIAVKFEF